MRRALATAAVLAAALGSAASVAAGAGPVAQRALDVVDARGDSSGKAHFKGTVTLANPRTVRATGVIDDLCDGARPSRGDGRGAHVALYVTLAGGTNAAPILRSDNEGCRERGVQVALTQRYGRNVTKLVACVFVADSSRPSDLVSGAASATCTAIYG